MAACVVWFSNTTPSFISTRGAVHFEARAIGAPLDTAVAGAPQAMKKCPSYLKTHAAIGALTFSLLASIKQAFCASKGQQSHACRVVMNARYPNPSPPASAKGNRRTMAGKHRWFWKGRQVRVRTNPVNGKPVRYRMHVRAGDTVQVVKGKDAGKVATVWKVWTKWEKVTCIGVNYCIKHVRPMRQDEVGQRVQVEAPMHASNVMHYSEAEGVAGYLGIKYDLKEDGKVRKIRYNKATNEEIPYRRAPKWVPVLEREEDDVDDEE
eukprot:CAMPEP_0172726840 /NCGR_PEP_ID=MMETSP1074-20121228/91341_1 /TAXON_ID=2916 /ORGANISM="Ceratium fusus, Strain PA161109" /LENGTH=264 /DNA_ID=CAMNT_0013553937 /DNA_START=74 /DNA_END=868 /DNA_ORIENTATION=+